MVATTVATVAGAMADRDWLSELSEAIGDDAPPLPPAAPGEADEMLLSGSGRPLDGWADQLASAIGEELEAAPAEPAEPAPEPTPAPTPAPAADRFAKPSFTTWAGAPVASVDPEVLAARLARVESLLSADLNRLGPAVLSESIAAIEARVEAALARLAGLDGPLAQLEERVSAHARTLEEPVRVHAVLPAALAEHLVQLTARLASLEQTIADAVEDPEEGGPKTAVEVALLAEVALQRADQQQTTTAITDLGEILEKLHARVDDLAARPVSAIDPASAQPVLDFEPMLEAFNEHRINTNSLAAVLRHLQESLDELVQRPVPEPPEPVEIEPVIAAVVALHRELSTISSAVTELAARPARPSRSARSLPAADLAPVEAALTEQRRELVGIAAAVNSIEELRQVVTQLYTAVVDAAARPAELPGVEVVVPPESLAPVARVLGNRIEEGRQADRASIEQLASGFSDRLAALESRLEELAANLAAQQPG